MAIDRETIRGRVLDRVENNTGFHESAIVDRNINRSVQILNLFTGRLQTRTFIAGFSVANQHVYTVPTGVALISAVYFENEPLKRNSIRNFSKAHPNWLNETTDKVPDEVAVWIPIGISKFAIWPADSAGGHTIRVEGVADPTFTGADAETFGFGEEATEALEEHTVHMLSAAEGGKIFRDTTLRIFRKTYREKMLEMQIWQADIMPHLQVELKAPQES